MTKVALLIGVSEYEPGLNPLPGAVKDVEALQQVLQHPDMGQFAVRDVTVLKNPDRQTMEGAIEALFTNRQKDDLVLLFFSGHGIKDDMGQLYLAARSTRKTPQGELMRSSAVQATTIHGHMSRSLSRRQVVILDSCFSGAFAEGLFAKDDGVVNIREQLGGEGRAILTSSTSMQYSFEQQEAEISLYTRFLIEGMTTGAADQNADGFTSIGELHEYASQKVQEIKPTMKPEIYPGKEGYTIKLAKVLFVDLKEQYRKEVKRFVKRGEVTTVGRMTLDVKRTRLGLSAAEAAAIEEEVLATPRQEFREKLREYEQTFSTALQQEVALSEADLDLLRQNLQQMLGLRSEDTSPLEQRVRARRETYKQHLQTYSQALAEAMRQEHPLSESARLPLQQMQQQWELADEDVATVKTRIEAELKEHQRKLQQYEQAFSTATQQAYPLSVAQRHALRQVQQALGLTEADLAPLEARITVAMEAYQQDVQHYEQALVQSMQDEYPLSAASRAELQRFQEVLGLGDEVVAQIEEKIVRQKAAQQSQSQQVDPENREIDQAMVSPASSAVEVPVREIGPVFRDEERATPVTLLQEDDASGGKLRMVMPVLAIILGGILLIASCGNAITAIENPFDPVGNLVATVIPLLIGFWALRWGLRRFTFKG